MKTRASNKNEPHKPPNQTEIAQRAHEIWEAAGRPAGRDLDNWFQAEHELVLNRSKNVAHAVRIDPKSRT